MAVNFEKAWTSGIRGIVPFPGMHISHAGRLLGNVDPRYGEEPYMAERENRMLLTGGLPPLLHSYVITPKGAEGIVDVDKSDTKINESPFFDEIDVNAEALITREANTVLSLNPADCIPLVYGSPSRGVLSMIHVGRRGATERFHQEVARLIDEEYKVSPRGSTTYAYLGPSIHEQSYVMEELRGALADDPDWKPFIRESDEGFHVDIPRFVVATLGHIGVSSDRIGASNIDTGIPESDYFSYVLHKKDPEAYPNGRNGFMAMMTV